MRNIWTIAAIVLSLSVSAQGPLTLSLQQAMDLAAKQSYAVQAGVLDAEKAEEKIKEVTAFGLPQIEGTGSFNNYLEVPTSVIPNFTQVGPEFLQIQFGLPYTTTGVLQLNQLIFDGSYIVGLRASRELRTRSTQDLERIVADARNQAAKAYLGVLAAREGGRLSAESVPVLEKSLSEGEAMLSQGFMETTDVDRLRIALANARDNARGFTQQESVALAFLRLVLGIPAETPVTLSSDLETIVNDPAEVALSSMTLDLNGHIDFQLANTMVRLQELEVKNQKSAYLPKLLGFINTQQQAFGFTTPVETDWFPATLWGLQLQVPIFSSGLRSSRVQQAQLTMQQTQVNLTATQQRLLAEAQERSQKARTTMDSYTTAQQNLELTKRIFDHTSIKFTNGLSGSFELNQDQTQYLTSQQQYIGALVDLLLARAELRKALDLY
ncbi:MAG TPA: TolC family protein [Flavobacteriales bacterium]|nr:TolC family protein [Flavobacteriales bacterium]